MAPRIRPNRKRKQSSSRGSIIAVLLVIILVVSIAGVAFGTMTVQKWLEDLPDHTDKEAFEVARPTLIYANDGETLLARLYLEDREVISIDQMAPILLKAVVAVEDERFYEHNGVDVIGIARSAVSILQGTRQGGSTITQQYIRNTILRDEARDISLRRKVREAYLAMQIEKTYSKDEILRMYLNTVYFGEGAYGVEAASQAYFAKSASELSIPEAALIAGMPQRPSKSSPYEYPEEAKKRRDQVLRRMLSNEVITQAEYDEAVATEIAPQRKVDPLDGVYAAPYYVAQVRKDLQEQFSQAVVFGGGLKVVTAIDMKMQAAAESSVAGAIGAEGPEGALVSIDPKTGDVKALVGGRDYAKNKFNMATQAKRQAGSSFKTFALVAAINDGISPQTIIDSSSPASIPTKPKPWIVENSEGRGRGPITLDAATRSSVNTVYARLTWGMGAEKVAEMANLLGIKTKLSNYPSISLGAQNVTPLEMASAYATLANDGIYNEPTFIKTVHDRRGELIYNHEPEGKRVISSEVAYASTSVLKGVVSGGTGTRARLGNREVAGKTGTSQLNRDVWFCGYTPQLSTAVWVGHVQERTIVLNGRRAFGGTVCAPIFHNFMTAALEGMPVEHFKTASAPPYTADTSNIPTGKPVDMTGKTLQEVIAEYPQYTIYATEVWSDKPVGTVISMRISGQEIHVTVSKGPDPAANQPSPKPTPDPTPDPDPGPGPDPDPDPEPVDPPDPPAPAPQKPGTGGGSSTPKLGG